MTHAAATFDARYVNRLTLVPVLGVGAVLGGFGLALFAPSAASGSRLGDGSFVAIATALSCALTLSLLPMARRAAGVRGAWAVALSLGAQGLFPVFSAAVKLGDPYIASHWRCVTGDVAFVLVAPMVAAAMGVIALLTARFGLPRVGAGAARAVRALAMAVLAGSLAVAGLGAARVAQRPAARDYLAQIPLAGTVPAVTVRPAMAPRIDVVGRALVWRQCDVENGCELRLRAPDLSRESIDGRMVRVGAGALRVRSDERTDLVLFEGEVALGGTVAFRKSAASPVDVSWRTLADVAAPPTAWLASALAGLAMALLVWARGGASARALSRWRNAREATLTEHGAVTFGEDLPAAKVQGEAKAPVGPVLVLDDASATHLRAMATVPAASLRAGTQRDLAEEIALADGGRYVLAATVAAWSVAPLALTVLR
jgi:hypothetical protein